VTLVAVGCGRDEKSYQYGATQISVSAGMVLRAPKHAQRQAHNSPGEACRIAVDTLPWSTLADLDRDDVIDGCTDALKG
jgi:hypothetical protein